MGYSSVATSSSRGVRTMNTRTMAAIALVIAVLLLLFLVVLPRL